MEKQMIWNDHTIIVPGDDLMTHQTSNLRITPTDENRVTIGLEVCDLVIPFHLLKHAVEQIEAKMKHMEWSDDSDDTSAEFSKAP
jgi:hypothetical protein